MKGHLSFYDERRLLEAAQTAMANLQWCDDSLSKSQRSTLIDAASRCLETLSEDMTARHASHRMMAHHEINDALSEIHKIDKEVDEL